MTLYRSRTAFLAGFVTAAVAAGVPRCIGAQPALSLRRNIDVHQHILPPEYLAAARAAGRIADVGEAPAILGWNPQQSLERMDQLGIDQAITSISTPGVTLADAANDRRLARACNEYAANLAREHPGRFGSFASLPLTDVQGSLIELTYAFDQLRADGVVLMSVYGNRWVGDAAFAPVLDELNRRKAIVFVHPSVGDCCRTLIPNVNAGLIEYPQDTTRAIVSLLIGGTFTRCPDIRFIFPHGGGTMPMLADRVARQTSARRDLNLGAPPLAILKHQYYDVALSVSAPALAAIVDFADPSKILFGSDFPFVDMGYTTAGLRNAGLSSERLNAIERTNAMQLLTVSNRAVTENRG
jgi:predicted TIM-barrel fold metal-dependent hydrolase